MDLVPHNNIYKVKRVLIGKRNPNICHERTTALRGELSVGLWKTQLQVCFSYFEPDEQPSNWTIVKWLSYSQFWPKKPNQQRKSTQNRPIMNNVSWYFPVKNFHESTHPNYKTSEKKSMGKGSAASKPTLTITLI